VDQLAALDGVDRGGTSAETRIAAVADFDEYQGVLVAHDQIELPAAVIRIGGDIGKPGFFQVRVRSGLDRRAARAAVNRHRATTER
jgi:hypothetical protein